MFESGEGTEWLQMVALPAYTSVTMFALPEGRDLNLQAWRSLGHAFWTVGSLSKLQNSTIRSRGCKASGYSVCNFEVAPELHSLLRKYQNSNNSSFKNSSPTRLILNSKLHFVPDLHVKT